MNINANNVEEFGKHLDTIWDRKLIKVDFIGLESTLVLVLASEFLSASQKVAFCKETIDAYTKRGHFTPDQYPGTRKENH